MNLQLFASRYAAVALVAAAGSVLLALFTTGRTFLLWSGVEALLLYAIVVAYSLRKYAHKLGISPEFRMRVPGAAIERAELRLKQLRLEMDAGRLSDVRVIGARARAVLREEKVLAVVRPQVERSSTGELTLSLQPTMPLGRTEKWLQAHFYLGVAAAVVVVLHGGGGFGDRSQLVLNGLAYLVLLSGLCGIACWVWGPNLMTAKERRAGLSMERAHALDERLHEKVAEATGKLGPELQQEIAALRQAAATDWSALLQRHGSDAVQDVVVLLGQHGAVRRRLLQLSALRTRLNLWRVVHVPAAVLLLCAVAMHVFAVAWY